MKLQEMSLEELRNKEKELNNTIWTLGFRLASREIFDKVVEVEREIELRVQQIKTVLEEGNLPASATFDIEGLFPGWEELREYDKFKEFIMN